MNSFRRFLFFVFCISLSLSAQADFVTCHYVFTPRNERVFFPLTNRERSFVFDNLSLEEYVETYSWYRRRQIRKAVDGFDLAKFHSQAEIENYAARLSILLFGSRTVADRFLLQSTQENERQSALLLAKEKILRQGLTGFWLNHGEPVPKRLLGRFLDGLRKINHSKPMIILQSPFSLFTLKDKTLADQLLLKIIEDGYDKHEDEVRSELAGQNRIEAFNSFRRIYAASIWGFIAVAQVQFAIESRNEAIQIEVQKAIHELRESRETIQDLTKLAIRMCCFILRHS